jgi:hypothetical protein
MNVQLLHIARAGREIGVYPIESVRSKVVAGELLLTDNYWMPGMATWLELSVLPPAERTLPFPRPKEKSASLLDGLFGRESYHAGLLAVWDKLSQAPVECHISEADWLDLDAKVGFEIRKRCRSDLLSWYRQAVDSYLSDRYFAPEEKTNLSNLGLTFGFGPKDVESIHVDAFASYCRVGMLTVLLRDIPPKQKREQIDLLGKEVPLPDSKVKEIFGEAIQSYYDKRIKEMTQQEDGCEVIEPSAYAAFAAEVKGMDINLSLDGKSQARLENAQRLWKALRTPLTEVPCSLDLGSEGCYWTREVILGVNKRVTTRRSYGGFGTSIKIWGPLRYRSGSYDVERQTEQRLEKVDSGTLVFTSKRVIFSGSLKSMNFKFSKILNVTVYSDAIEIDKDTGGDVVFFFPDGQAEAAVILRRLVKQAKG